MGRCKLEQDEEQIKAESDVYCSVGTYVLQYLQQVARVQSIIKSFGFCHPLQNLNGGGKKEVFRL